MRTSHTTAAGGRPSQYLPARRDARRRGTADHIAEIGAARGEIGEARNTRHAERTGHGGGAFGQIHELAASVELPDPHGHRKEFLELVRRADALSAPVKQPIAPLQDDELG